MRDLWNEQRLKQPKLHQTKGGPRQWAAGEDRVSATTHAGGGSSANNSSGRGRQSIVCGIVR